MSWLDSLFGIPNLPQAGIMNNFNSALIKVQALIPALQTAQNVADSAVTTAQGLESNSDASIVSKAQGVEAEAQAASDECSNALSTWSGMTSALNQQLSDFTTNIYWQTDTTKAYVDSTKLSGDSLAAFNSTMAATTELTNNLTALASQINKAISDANTANSDAQSVVNTSEGKGISGIFSGLGSGLASETKTIVTIGAVGLAAYLFLPGIVSGLMRKKK